MIAHPKRRKEHTMITKLTTLACIATAAITLSAVASASSAPAKQRVIITQNGAGFVLSPRTSGPIKPDTGTANFCCWTRRSMTQDGEDIELNNPQMTLAGKHGTLVARNQIAWVDIPDGQSVFTGTWKVIRGTGAYAGLTGGGRAAGLSLANGNTKAQFEGFLGLK
jgi:hypothetical protein